MKVLKNNYNGIDTHITKVYIEPYPRELECGNCSSKLEYDESDIEVGALGAMHVRCPLCGYNNMLDWNEYDITLTKNNIEFPTHFFYMSKENGAKDTCDNRHIKKEIDKAIEFFKENKDKYHWFTSYGNLYISVRRFDGDEKYYIVATNNYFETYIPFEPEDY